MTSFEDWERYVAGLPVDDPVVPRVILLSWQRSQAAGVRPRSVPRLHRLPADEVRRRVRANGELIRVARKHLRWVTRLLYTIPHAAYLVDGEGVVLDAAGIPQDAMEAWGLLPGYDWSEARMGTNGAGTALVAGRPVAVIGCEHFVQAWHGLS